MPRVRDTTSEDNIVPRKPRVRKPRVTSDDVTPKTRKSATPKPKSPAVSVSTETVRKAPTQIKAQRNQKQKNTYALLGVFIFCLLVTVSGVGLGFSDRGQIDVVAVVNDRNEKINKGEIRDANGQPLKVTVPVQNSDSRPNGGLVIADSANTPIANPETPTDDMDTASSTATSTEETIDTSTSTSDVPETPASDVESI